MTVPEVIPFEVTEDLPSRGRLAVGASAGTGKTWTLAALATRHVAERGVPVGELLVVTFTRAAAAELRERIRARFASTARDLEALAPGSEHPDPLVAHLLGGTADECTERRRRLERAVVDFDTATITTIHGFCAQVLAAQGSTGPFDPAAVLVQDPSEIVDSVVADVLVEAALDPAPDPDSDSPGEPLRLPLSSRLGALARIVLSNPGIRIVASNATPTDELVAELTRRVVERVDERLLLTGGVTFDDQLSRVAELLEQDADLRRTLSTQFSVVMIDESQDTDPVQWAALSRAFEGSPSVTVVVGDPKQAIYSFRGGDVHNYLDAVGRAEQRRTLTTNFRSDVAVVSALNRLAADAELGHPEIVYEQVEPAPALSGRSLHVRGAPAPGLWVRSVTDPHQRETTKKVVDVSRARWTVAEDLAGRVVELVDHGEVVDADGTRTPVRPEDIAVLIRARSDAAPVQRALLERGVASVVIGAGSVTSSLAASHWRWLIEGLKRPSDARLARAVGTSWFFDVAVDDLAAGLGADPDERGADTLTHIQESLLAWGDVLRRQGVAALVERVWRDGDIRARVLSRPTGERDLTDLDHLAELLHLATGGRPVGAEVLGERFDALDDPDDEAVEDPDAVRRRVDSDTSAVRIMTIHVAKGLEFPVVCCPTLWSMSNLDVNSRTYHDPSTGDRVLDVSSSPDDAIKQHAQSEADGEHRRLTYVALTRALHTTLVWWVPSGPSHRSGLARVLFGEGDASGTAAVPDDWHAAVDVITERVHELGADDVVRVELVPPDPPSVPMRRDLRSTVDADDRLELATLGRTLDRSAGRWSFTAMTARARHDAPTEHRPAGAGTVSDPDDPTLGDASDGDEQHPAPPVLFDGLGAGAAFGTMVHSALEAVDFTGDLEGQLTEVLDVPWSNVEHDQVPRLVRAIAATIHTPLGDAFGGLSLRSLARADRLDELDFELPLGRPGHPTVAASTIGEVLADHLPDGDPLRDWSHRLAVGHIPVDVGGHLTGSIDLVLRAPTDAPGGFRYGVVDYKTNRLGSWGQPDTVANYHPDRLPAAMEEHDYPLQAVLYSVALHRYLRWRLPGYEPDVHLGPVGYLFVRGMVGPDTPAPDGRTHGVFSWRVPAAAVVELSDGLDGHLPEVVS